MKLLFEKLNITEIFNVPYCSQFNGIESYFSQLEGIYKKLLLKCVIIDALYDTIGLIKQSIESMSNEKCDKVCEIRVSIKPISCISEIQK